MAKKHFNGYIQPSKWQEAKTKIKDSLKGLTPTEKFLAFIFGLLFGKVFILIFLVLFITNFIKSIFIKIYLLLSKIKNKIF